MREKHPSDTLQSQNIPGEKPTSEFKPELAEKTVFFLGSSVTRGHGGDTDGRSFVEMIGELTGMTYQKRAISGTNLAIIGGRSDSYVERFCDFDFSCIPDALVLQLSTNDFANRLPQGTVGVGKAADCFDAATITGALETIFAQTLAINPACKIALYTCPLDPAWCNYTAYRQYIETILPQLQEKWKGTLRLLDLFHTNACENSACLQHDHLHPTSEGYARLFVPPLLSLLGEILSGSGWMKDEEQPAIYPK